MARVVLFGATGYTGHLTAQALRDRGAQFAIAGRNPGKLVDLATSLGGDSPTLVADVRDPASVAAIVEEGDVLVSTVGPFERFGRPAVEAAVTAGAHYVDATGEIGFAREVIEHYGPRAKARGVSLHTACGYDFIPGNCAAAVAIDRAGPAAEPRRVDVGYFASGDTVLRLSEGTFASLLGVMIEPGVFWKGGRHVDQLAGTRLRRFDVEGVRRPAVSISSTEQLYLPRLYPELQEINVFLGWFGKLSYLATPAANAFAGLRRLPGVQPLARRLVGRFATSSGRGPDAETRASQGSHIVAIARDGAGRELSRAELVGVHGYTFTANLLALVADRLARGELQGAGAVDPVTAFGLQGLISACAEAGLALR